MITLHDITTRELLNALRKWMEFRDDCDRDDLPYSFSRMVQGGVKETVTATFSEIHAELGGREHVPNKKQAATLRKVMAKYGCTKEEAWTKHGDEFFPKDRWLVSKEEYVRIANCTNKRYASKNYVIK